MKDRIIMAIALAPPTAALIAGAMLLDGPIQSTEPVAAPAWVSCSDGDRDYCAPYRFASEAECYRLTADWPYNDDGVCVIALRD